MTYPLTTEERLEIAADIGMALFCISWGVMVVATGGALRAEMESLTQLARSTFSLPLIFLAGGCALYLDKDRVRARIIGASLAVAALICTLSGSVVPINDSNHRILQIGIYHALGLAFIAGLEPGLPKLWLAIVFLASGTGWLLWALGSWL